VSSSRGHLLASLPPPHRRQLTPSSASSHLNRPRAITPGGLGYRISSHRPPSGRGSLAGPHSCTPPGRRSFAWDSYERVKGDAVDGVSLDSQAQHDPPQRPRDPVSGPFSRIHITEQHGNTVAHLRSTIATPLEARSLPPGGISRCTRSLASLRSGIMRNRFSTRKHSRYRISYSCTCSINSRRSTSIDHSTGARRGGDRALRSGATAPPNKSWSYSSSSTGSTACGRGP
jgi:hypothetical protein